MYNERAIALAGSDITFADAQKIFKEKTGLKSGMPETYDFMAKGVMWALKDIEVMFDWFVKEGYGAKIDQVKEIYPDLLDWPTWLEKESEWVKK